MDAHGFGTNRHLTAIARSNKSMLDHVENLPPGLFNVMDQGTRFGTRHSSTRFLPPQ